MIDYVLLSEGILDRIHKLSLGEWIPESDHRVYVLISNVLTKTQRGATLECKWEVFKKVVFSCTNKCFSTNHTSWKCIKKFRKKWFDKECREARKCLMVLDAVKDQENYQKHLHEYKRLIQRKRRI